MAARIRGRISARNFTRSRASGNRAFVTMFVGECRERLWKVACVGDDDLVIDRLTDRADQERRRKAASAAGDFLALFDCERWMACAGEGHVGLQGPEVRRRRCGHGSKRRSECGQQGYAAGHDGEARCRIAAVHELPPRRL
jgi:hypothetical protein